MAVLLYTIYSIIAFPYRINLSGDLFSYYMAVIFQKRTVTFITDRTFIGVSFIIITATERELL